MKKTKEAPAPILEPKEPTEIKNDQALASPFTTAAQVGSISTTHSVSRVQTQVLCEIQKFVDNAISANCTYYTFLQSNPKILEKLRFVALMIPICLNFLNTQTTSKRIADFQSQALVFCCKRDQVSLTIIKIF